MPVPACFSDDFLGEIYFDAIALIVQITRKHNSASLNL
jgi:hypothetical protein